MRKRERGREIAIVGGRDFTSFNFKLESFCPECILFTSQKNILSIVNYVCAGWLEIKLTIATCFRMFAVHFNILVLFWPKFYSLLFGSPKRPRDSVNWYHPGAGIIIHINSICLKHINEVKRLNCPIHFLPDLIHTLNWNTKRKYMEQSRTAKRHFPRYEFRCLANWKQLAKMSEQKRPIQKRKRAHRERANKNMIEFFFSDCLNDYYLFLKQRKISVAFLYLLIAYTIQYTHTNNDKENEQRKKKKMYKGMEQKNWIRVQQVTNMRGRKTSLAYIKIFGLCWIFVCFFLSIPIVFLLL